MAELQRLCIFAAWRMMGPDGRKEYRNWFEARTRDAAKVRAVIDEITGYEDLPSLAAVGRLWLELFPPAERAAAACLFCNGTGYEIIEAGMYSGARRCRCRKNRLAMAAGSPLVGPEAGAPFHPAAVRR